jgi:DNA-binding XRE family transcriptional regulator
LPNRQIALRSQRPKELGYPANPQTLGEHLKKRRIDLALFQKDVAQRIGASVASVWLWENNQAQPEVKWTPAIIAFLGYNPRRADETIGGRLIEFRVTRGWSQKQLAAELRVDPTTLSCWEREKKAPWGIYLDRVMELLRAKVG